MIGTFPLTLAAAKAHQLSRWALGDALLKEVGPPSANGANDGSGARIEAAAEYLMTHGIEYEHDTLRSFRAVAFAFPPVTRGTASFNICRTAGNPERLASIIKGKPKEQRLTVRYVYDEIQKAACAASAAQHKAWRERMEAKQATAVKEFIEAKPSRVAMLTLKIEIFAEDLRKATEEIAFKAAADRMGRDEAVRLANAAARVSEAALDLKHQAEVDVTPTTAKTIKANRVSPSGVQSSGRDRKASSAPPARVAKTA